MRDGSCFGSPITAKSQSVAYTGTAGTITNALPPNTVAVRIVTTTDCYVQIGPSPTATSSDMLMIAGVPETFTAGNGDKVSGIRLSADGTLYVTPLV